MAEQEQRPGTLGRAGVSRITAAKESHRGEPAGEPASERPGADAVDPSRGPELDRQRVAGQDETLSVEKSLNAADPLFEQQSAGHNAPGLFTLMFQTPSQAVPPSASRGDQRSRCDHQGDAKDVVRPEGSQDQ